MKRGFELTSNNREGAKLPKRGSQYSAGYDFYLPKGILIPALSNSEFIPLGVKAYMQMEEVLEIHVRSSIGIKKGLFLANTTGIIDADYYNNPDNEGEIGLVLFNNSDDDVYLKKGERICQGIFKPFLVSDNCNTDDSRTGGVGSTGTK